MRIGSFDQIKWVFSDSCINYTVVFILGISRRKIQLRIEQSRQIATSWNARNYDKTCRENFQTCRLFIWGNENERLEVHMYAYVKGKINHGCGIQSPVSLFTPEVVTIRQFHMHWRRKALRVMRNRSVVSILSSFGRKTNAFTILNGGFDFPQRFSSFLSIVW